MNNNELTMNDYITNADRLFQRLDFSGLAVDEHTRPMDIDIFMSKGKGKGYVIAEIKRGTKPLPKRQYAILVHLTDILNNAGEPTTLIVAEHNTKAEETVDVAQCRTRWYYNSDGQGCIKPTDGETLGVTWHKMIDPCFKK